MLTQKREEPIFNLNLVSLILRQKKTVNTNLKRIGKWFLKKEEKKKNQFGTLTEVCNIIVYISKWKEFTSCPLYIQTLAVC